MFMDFLWSFVDLNFFLNVINGVILFYCEDGVMLWICLVFFINIVVYFSYIFVSDG